MRKILSILCITALCLAFLPSCGENGERTGDFYTFKDALGNEVALDKRPQRVAVLFSSFADIWQLAGGRVDVTVGDAVKAGHASKDALTVDEGSGHSGINMELLAASAPDLVIATADYPAQVQACDFMRSLGVPAAALRVESFEDYLRTLKIFTEILGTEERYARYGQSLSEEIARLKSEYSTRKECDMLFLRVTKSSHKAMSTDKHFAASMIGELGVENIADSSSDPVGGDLLELSLRRDPCYVFVSFMGDEGAARAYIDSVFKTEGWNSLSAVKNGRVIYLPKELFQLKPNELWADAYEFLIKAISSDGGHYDHKNT